ncbi:MAG: DUF4249 family protein [Bacteroidetes bacterium]|nr:DUF4249 family protein [Bacteroidota bacterium]
MGRASLLMFLAAAALFAACQDDFSPKTEFTRQLVVFAVLDPAQDVQTVRLAWSYDAEIGPVSTPLTETEVADAEVRIQRGGETYVFRDTLFTSSDGRQHRAWINRELRPVPERDYRLTVTVSGHPTVTSTVAMPSRLYVRADRVKPDTGLPSIHAYHGVTTFTNPPAAFYFRIWLEIEKWTPTETLRPRRELPLQYSAEKNSRTYTSPDREEEQVWSTNMLRLIADEMIQPGDSVLARRVIVQCYGLESNFYSYYKIVRGFDDPLSVRLDRPDISFIDGGLGVFGAMVSDSIVYNYYRFIRE